MKAWRTRGRQDHLPVVPPVLLRAAGALALAGAAVMVIAGAGRPDAEAPQAALAAATLDPGAEAAASPDSPRPLSPADPSRAAGDLLPPSTEPGLWQPAAASAGMTIGAGAGPDAATAATPKDPARLAAAAEGAPEPTGAVDGRKSIPAETVEAAEPVPEAPRAGEASRPADPTFEQAYAPAEAPAGEAAEMTALLVVPPIPKVRPEAPPARRQEARKSTRATRASRPSDPPPNCGKKRARWRYVKDVPTWYCR